MSPGPHRFALAYCIKKQTKKKKPRSTSAHPPRVVIGIITVQEYQGKIARYRPPTFFFRQVQYEVIAVLAGNEKASRDILPLAVGHNFAVFLVVSKGDDVDRFRHVDPLPRQELAEDRAHLLESGGHIVSLDIVRIGDQGKVTGINADPVRFVGARRRKWSAAEQERESKKDEA